MATLSEDIAALADDEAVMRAVAVLTGKGINGAMFEKLMAGRPTQKIAYTVHRDDGTGHCTACGTAWPTECVVEKKAVWL